MNLSFSKINGAGNDYILVDCLERDVKLATPQIVQLCDRHFGVGSDGVILVKQSGVADVRMEMYNSDGSRGAMCGNGVRCVAELMRARGHAGDHLLVDTDSGMRAVEIVGRDGGITARVRMGKPELCGEYTVKLAAACKAAKMPNGFTASLVSMGNPHAVVFCKNVDAIDLAHVAEGFLSNPVFRDGVNVEIAQMLDTSTLKVRVFERGAGETLACGTGACASAVAAVAKGYFERSADIAVQMRGGVLRVCWPERGEVTLCGPAKTAFTGVAEL